MRPHPFDVAHRGAVGRPLPDRDDVHRRLAEASLRLVALRNDLDLLQADLSWLHVTAAGGPDLGQAE